MASAKKKSLRVVDDLGRPVASSLRVARGDDEVIAEFVDGVCVLDAKAADEVLGLAETLGFRVQEFVPDKDEAVSVESADEVLGD